MVIEISFLWSKIRSGLWWGLKIFKCLVIERKHFFYSCWSLKESNFESIVEWINGVRRSGYGVVEGLALFFPNCLGY